MAENDPMIGTMIEEYRVDSLLGQGGMGAVYKGFDTKLRRYVAIKMLLTTVQGSEAYQRFDREARIVASLNHPNLAQIFRVGEHNGQPYYVMEYIDGKSLHDLLEGGNPLAGQICVKYMKLASQGLKAAADQGIIHRDIKPANIMVTREGELKVVDFGLAKGCSEDTLETRVGTIMGTPRYMSPEQGKGEEVDLRSDIYSLGATFYHMVTGSAPFAAENPMSMIMKHATEPVEPIYKRNPNVPNKLSNLIYAMMEKKPDDRVQSYSILIGEIECIFAAGSSALGDHTQKVTSPQPVAAGQSAGDFFLFQPKWIAAGLGTIIVIMVAIALVANSGAKPAAAPQPKKRVMRESIPERLSDTAKSIGEIVKIRDQQKKDSEEF